METTDSEQINYNFTDGYYHLYKLHLLEGTGVIYIVTSIILIPRYVSL